MPSRVAPDLKTQEEVTGMCLRKEHMCNLNTVSGFRFFLFKKDLLLFILCILYCCEVSPPETTQTLLKPRRKSLLPAGDCMGNLSKSCSPEPCSPFVCNTQTPLPGCHTAASKKQNYRSKKDRLVLLGTFLELRTRSLMGRSLFLF